MWIFIAGPFAGSILAVIFYKVIYTPAFNRYYKNIWLIYVPIYILF